MKTPAATPPAHDALAKLKDRAGAILFERLGTRLLDASLTEEQLHALVQEELVQVVEEEEVPLTKEERSIRASSPVVLSGSPPKSTCERSSSASSPALAGASTSLRRWSTPGLSTGQGSTRSFLPSP
jgi:hypothetical protein